MGSGKYVAGLAFRETRRMLRRISEHGHTEVRFISPLLCTVLAAKKISEPTGWSVDFSDACKPYADRVGLTEALGLEATSVHDAPTSFECSPLTRLVRPSDVNQCNAVIVDLLTAKLADNWAAINSIANVVGELHDNVTSHACGAGFSAASVYRQGETDWIRFAVADAGRGMLRNVKLVEPAVATDLEAIAWCLKKGNSTGKTKRKPWEQRLPEDSVWNPYPPSVDTATDDGLHAGLGLWTLTKFAEKTGCRFWIGTGQSEYMRFGWESRTKRRSTVRWHGLAIEIAVNVTRLCESARTAYGRATRWGL